MPEVTQQIRILSQGAVPPSFNRRDPSLPPPEVGGGETPVPQREGQSMGWESARLSFPLDSVLGTPPPTLGTHPGETSAGLGTGPAPGNPLQAGRSQQAWRPQVRETPSLTAWLPVPGAPHLFSWRGDRGQALARITRQDDRRMEN